MKRREMLATLIAESQAWLAQHSDVPAGKIQPFAIEEAQISMIIPIYSVNNAMVAGLADIAQKHGLRLAGWRIRANENSSEITPASMLWLIVEMAP